MRIALYLTFERRALRRRVAELEKALHAEAQRNREREDELINSVLTAAGRYGLAPRRADVQSFTPPPLKASSPLNAIEEAQLEAYRQAARDAGRPAEDGDAYFYSKRVAQTEIYQPPQSTL
jgi:hypothetical protein